MKLLLDTPVLLWAIASPTKLSATARNLLLQPSSELFLSAASLWEIQLKRRAGKLTLPAEADFLPSHIRRLGVQQVISVSPEHAYRVLALPSVHKDPFDCLLAAQALTESLTLLSVDPAFTLLGAAQIW